MHIDARELENNSLIEGDICIIGAGAAGISIALEWINTPYKVILLEGGGFNYDEKVQKLYKGKTTGRNYFPLMSCRLHSFGGTTGLWGGYCSPFDPIDFEERNWIVNSGWPISLKDLDPYYKKAQNYLELHSDNYNIEYWQTKDSSRVHLPIDKKVVWDKMWQFSPPTRFASKYKDAIINAKNIHLYTYANAVSISANEDISSVKEVLVKNYANKTHKVKATHFILACGAIQNARLLLASNKQNSKGLGNENDIVGRYFMEHLEFKTAELWLNKPQSMNLYMLDFGKTKARAELAITAPMQKKHKILNGTASLRPLKIARHEESQIEHWKNEDLRKNKYERSIWEKIKNRTSIFKESRIKSINNAYELYTRLEQAPNSSSRIILGNENDSLGVPRANLHWELSSLEKRSIRKIYDLIGHQVGINDVGRVKLMEGFSDKNDESLPEFVGGGWHHTGTTRMHTNPKKGVVDANCKVHGIDNLFVAGSSCFTTSGAVNPTFTLVALSLRLSDHLKEKMTH